MLWKNFSARETRRIRHENFIPNEKIMQFNASKVNKNKQQLQRQHRKLCF